MFFKAYGHEDVFGLKSCIPEGGTTMEVTEDVPSEDGLGRQTEENVLYVRLPEGHPVITAEERPQSQLELRPSSSSNSADPFNIEEAIEQAELIFEDDSGGIDVDFETSNDGNDCVDKAMADIDPCFSVPDLLVIEETTSKSDEMNDFKESTTPLGVKRTSPRNAAKKTTETLSTVIATVATNKMLKSNVSEPIVVDVTSDGSNAEPSPKVKLKSPY
jgi:hypothetical protein